MRDLPGETKATIAGLLTASASLADDDWDARLELAERLNRARDAGLDDVPGQQILGINGNAPLRAIQEAVQQVVSGLKERADLPERRRRHDSLPQYLQVWDLREGWVGGGYDIEQERSFPAIATQLSLPYQTVVSQYRAAFRLISGHPYSSENWIRLFIVVKLTGQHGIVALRRRPPTVGPRGEGAVILVPESALSSPERSRNGFLSGEAEPEPAEYDQVETLIDIEHLILERFNDDAIISRLELADTDDVRELIQSHRRRVEDSRPA